MLKRFFIILILTFAVIFIFLKIYTYYYINKNCFSGKSVYFPPDTTEVYVIGVVHKETNNITYDSLYNCLERIKPNIILFECDSLRFNDSMEFNLRFSSIIIPYFKSLGRSNLEEIACLKYISNNKFAIVRPYEWKLRDSFHEKNEIFKKSTKVFEELRHLSLKNELNKNEELILNNYYFYNNLIEEIGDGNLSYINSNYQDSLTKIRQKILYKEIKVIIDNNPLLKDYKKFYNINSLYWDMRNKSMAKNIIHYIKNNKKSRIVVLNGFYHRYYLREELEKVEPSLNFKLINF